MPHPRRRPAGPRVDGRRGRPVRAARQTARWVLLVVLFAVGPALATATTAEAAPDVGGRANAGTGVHQAPGGQWTWPLAPRPEVVAGFHPPARRWQVGHRGVDLLGRRGQPVRAAGAGVVSYAGLLAGRGVVTVTHGALRTTYEPVAASVVVGQRVAAGVRIGTLDGAGSHCPPRTCLHWGLLRGREYLDPLALLSTGPLRLLPFDAGPSEGGVLSVPTPAGGQLGAGPAGAPTNGPPGTPWSAAVGRPDAGLSAAVPADGRPAGAPNRRAQPAAAREPSNAGGPSSPEARPLLAGALRLTVAVGASSSVAVAAWLGLARRHRDGR